MKPVVYEDFWGPFRKIAPKSIKKALGLSVKVDAVLRLRKTSKKHWLHNVLKLPGKIIKIPYKTCCFLILSGPFSQKGLQKYQKRIRFAVKVNCILGLRKTSKNRW